MAAGAAVRTGGGGARGAVGRQRQRLGGGRGEAGVMKRPMMMRVGVGVLRRACDFCLGWCWASGRLLLRLVVAPS